MLIVAATGAGGQWFGVSASGSLAWQEFEGLPAASSPPSHRSAYGVGLVAGIPLRQWLGVESGVWVVEKGHQNLSLKYLELPVLAEVSGPVAAGALRVGVRFGVAGAVRLSRDSATATADIAGVVGVAIHAPRSRYPVALELRTTRGQRNAGSSAAIRRTNKTFGLVATMFFGS